MTALKIDLERSEQRLKESNRLCQSLLSKLAVIRSFLDNA